MDELGFRTDLPDVALPSLTWQALQRVPVIVVSLAVVLGGVYHVRGRKAPHA